MGEAKVKYRFNPAVRKPQRQMDMLKPHKIVNGACEKCGGISNGIFNSTLTVECPNMLLSERQLADIMSGELNFRNGQFYRKRTGET